MTLADDPPVVLDATGRDAVSVALWLLGADGGQAQTWPECEDCAEIGACLCLIYLARSDDAEQAQ